MVGARVGFFRGDIRLLTDDIKELRPTLVPVVPRVLNRIYDKVMQEVNKSSLKRALFDWGVAAKTRELKWSVSLSILHYSISTPSFDCL
jgi:long-chain acyl-CoA synthetase